MEADRVSPFALFEILRLCLDKSEIFLNCSTWGTVYAIFAYKEGRFARRENTICLQQHMLASDQ